MKLCKVCKQNPKFSGKALCRECYNANKRQQSKSILRPEYNKCVITIEDKKYNTTELNRSDVIELINKGYGFIFRDKNLKMYLGDS